MDLVDTHRFLPLLDTRYEYFRFLDAKAIPTSVQQYVQLPSHINVSAYILECPPEPSPISPQATLKHSEIERVDDDLVTIRASGDQLPWALAETAQPRFPVLYTALPPQNAATRLRSFQAEIPQLDRTWFSSTMYLTIWRRILATSPSHRFSSLTFEHEQFFASREASIQNGNLPKERRKARIKVTDRLNKLSDAVLPWSGQYSALSSIVHMRIPALARGGYDVYHDGRVTDNSDSTALFREEIRELTEFYDQATRAVEHQLWPRPVSDRQDAPIHFGTPLFVQFSEPLSDDVFRRWTSSFRRKNNRFRLWGQPIERGPQKVHIYAVDNLLWQTIDLEITPSHLIALLPHGTCGNTVHRLITAIQRFVDPAVAVSLGDMRYDDAIAAPATGRPEINNE